MHTIEKRGFWALINTTVGICAFKSLLTDTAPVNEVINLLTAIAGLSLGMHYLYTKFKASK